MSQMAQFHEKLGDRGDKPVKKESDGGTKSAKVQTSWEGTTKGATKHRKPSR